MASYTITRLSVPPALQPRSCEFVELAASTAPVSQPRASGNQKGIRVRMRAYNPNLLPPSIVYWTADEIDPSGDQYPGPKTPNPLENVVEVDELIG